MRRSIMAALVMTATLAPLGCSSDDSASDAGNPTTVQNIDECPTTFDGSVGKYPLAALPTGQTCRPATTCHMAIDDCASDFTTDPVGPGLEEYECLCTAGVWACTLSVVVQGGCGEAGAARLDAGEDSADDAPADAPVDSTPGDAVDAAADSPSDATADASDGSLGDAGLDATLDAADAP